MNKPSETMTRAIHPGSLRPLPSRLLAALLASTALVGCQAALAQSLPTGGSVAAGSAAIGTAANGALTVVQSSSSAVLNWQSFSVGQGNSVTFSQPSSTSAILNRVTGSTPSTIAGQINANGQVYLVNPNGIAITPTGTVNAGAFVASTLGISDDDFMSGRRRFTGNGASASVTNQGTVTIGRGGYAALLGGAVDNAGAIIVPFGKVGLGSGEQATLDLAGDGFLQVAVPTAAAGNGALVKNSGMISANGGLVQLSAAAARDMARQAINMSGTIEAKTVSGRNGAITLGGSDGEVEFSGKLAATGRRTTGGAVTVTGRKIALKGATVDASGETGGGTVRIGGGRQGAGTLQRAEAVSIDAASNIRGDARSTGNGGDIVVWSDKLTSFAGTISARGGSLSGNGGEVEVSGKAKLDYTGFTDLRAANGAFGNLLLDPYNVTISDGADTSGFTATGDDSVINNMTLLYALGAANVTVSTGSSGSQAGNITVAAFVIWHAPTTLTLEAAHDININDRIYNTWFGSNPSGLTLSAGGTISATADIGVEGTFTLNSGNWVQNGFIPSFRAFNFQINGGSFLRVSGGDGSSASPYLIEDAYGLQGIASSPTYLSSSWALSSDIYLSYTTRGWNGGAGFKPISGFAGTLDGNGLTMSGLTSTSGGLFASTTGTAVIKNIGLVDANVTGAGPYTGILVNENAGTIINAYTTGTVSAIHSAGGLVGRNSGLVAQSYSSATVTANSNNSVGWYSAGGLVGNNTSSGVITESHATGAFERWTGSYSGGLVGFNEGTISLSYATGAVLGSTYTGGFVGANHGTISQSYATGAVWGGYTNGGFVGINMNEISQSYATGAVLGDGVQGFGGGFVGDNGGTISRSYATGTVSNDQELATNGGFVGTNYSTISQSYATGAVSGYGGSAINGGFAGYNSSNISESYATGTAAGGNHGGFVGQNDSSITSSFWNLETSGLSSGVGSGNSTGVSGLTTAQLNNPTVLIGAGWDYAATWGMLKTGGAPVLRALTTAPVYDYYISLSGSTSTTYGDTIGTSDIAVSGLGAGNVTVGWGSAVSATTNAGTYAYGDSDVLALGYGAGSAGAYYVDYGSGALTVNKRALTVTAADQSRVYGDGSALSYSLTGGTLVNGDALSGALSGASAASSVGAYAIGQGTLSGGANYDVSYVLGTATVTVRPITISVTSGQSFVYGDTPTLAYSIGGAGLANGDTLSGALAGITSTTGVGSHAITQGTLAASSNYAVTYVGANASVTARPITISVTSGQSFVYGDTPTLAYSIGGAGLANGDALSGALAGITSTTGVGSHAITQGSLAASSNYAVTYVGANASVTARPITINVTSGQSFVYGDTPTLAYSIGGAGLANGDTLSGALAGITSTTGVGSYAITQGTLAASSNYAVTYVGANASVTARPITISVTSGQSFVYGDTPTLAYSITSGNLVNGDALSGALAGITSTTGVGSYAITQGMLAASSNYAVTYVGANANVAARPITISVTSGQSFVYGDTPTLAYSITSGNLVNGDALSGALAGITSTTGVGSHAITQGTLAASSNYAVTYVGANASVTARPITIGVTSGQSFVYGDTPTLAYSIGGAGLANGDALSGALAGITSTTGVGSYAITQGSLVASSNYAVTYVGANASVTARPITLTAASVTSIYGDSVPTLSYTMTSGNLVNGDGLSGSLTTSASSIAGVGSYAITEGSLAASSNYAVTYVAGTATITARAITVTANASTSVYGDAPSLGYAITSGNLVNGDALSGSLAGVSSMSGIGSYAITQGSLANANYAISYVAGTATVTARSITVTANASNSIYGDAPNLSYAITSGSLVNGDQLSGALAGVSSTSGVGSYAITQGTLANGNYLISYVGAVANVTARPITATAVSSSRPYGVANPTLAYKIGGRGLANGDALSGALATEANGTSAAGAYAITQGSLAASANYLLSFVPGTLTVLNQVNPDTATLAGPPTQGFVGESAPGDAPVIAGSGRESGGAIGSGTGLPADPRFDGILLCLPNGAGCSVAPPARS